MLIIFFLLGLIIGSFLNVVVYRLNVVETILGRSHCPYCRKKIRWYDNVPLLSFVLLKGRCRDCEKKISWRYPLVELLTGAVFALIGGHFFNPGIAATWLPTLFYLVAFSLLLIVFAYDVQYLEIPMLIIWIGVVWAIGYALFSDWQNFNPGQTITSLRIFSGVAAGLAAFLGFFLLSAVSKEKWMGMGDAYVALLVGLIVGWPSILLALLLAFVLGAFLGVLLILAKKKTLQSQLPFAPFLVVGALISLLYYGWITNWYWGLFY